MVGSQRSEDEMIHPQRVRGELVLGERIAVGVIASIRAEALGKHEFVLDTEGQGRSGVAQTVVEGYVCVSGDIPTGLGMVPTLDSRQGKVLGVVEQLVFASQSICR